MNTAAIILAAGRGSRMKNLTDDKPKCLVELAGKTLLNWQLLALQNAGIKKILVVCGYKKEKIKGNFDIAINNDWEKTNMLSSLLCASNFIDGAFADGYEKLAVSYSDIAYSYEHILKLISSQGFIAIAYDTLWKNLWQLRFGNDILEDAETFRQHNGKLLEIGKKTNSLSAIEGQYMGLLSINKEGWHCIKNTCQKLGEKTAKMDMTSFLGHMLAKNYEICAVPVLGKWCEADNEHDIKIYEKMLESGTWTHDWR